MKWFTGRVTCAGAVSGLPGGDGLDGRGGVCGVRGCAEIDRLCLRFFDVAAQRTVARGGRRARLFGFGLVLHSKIHARTVPQHAPHFPPTSAALFSTIT